MCVHLGCSVFFFQAEDGIRDLTVTGVQTCALPISNWTSVDGIEVARVAEVVHGDGRPVGRGVDAERDAELDALRVEGVVAPVVGGRSEERRVGEECRSRWSPYHLKKKRDNKNV